MTVTHDALRQIHLLKDLSDAALSVVAQAARVQRYDAGSDVCREGAQADGMFLLRSGSVRVHKAGAESDVVILGSGSYFGEMGLVDDGARSATVTAVEPCEALIVDAAALRRALDSQPAAAAAVYHAIARGIAKRLRATTDDLAFARQMALAGRQRG